MKPMKANRIRFTGIAFAAILALGGFSARAASKDELLRIAADRPVPGWSVMADSTTYVQGDGLTQIYNGGYEVYTKAGVADAVRRIYMQGEDYVEVTVHGMKSSQSAKDFLADRHRMEMGRSGPATAGWNSFSVSRTGATTVYAAEGRFFMTIVAYSEGAEGKAQTAPFLKALGGNAKKLLAAQK
jgi:hypothetical protein